MSFSCGYHWVGNIRDLFKLPANENAVGTDVMNYRIQDGHKDFNCLILQGFDHMGAGDVDCSDRAVQ